MAPSPLQQRRTHNTLLFQKLLNLREHGTSPFTLVLDNLEQGGGPVIREFARRGKVRASSFVSSRSIACDSGRVYCGVWPIKCRQGSKTDKSNCQVLKKSTYDWLVGNPSQDLLARDHIMQVYYSGAAFSFTFETWIRHAESRRRNLSSHVIIGIISTTSIDCLEEKLGLTQSIIDLKEPDSIHLFLYPPQENPLRNR
jgi:hypothetical protein